VFLFGTGANMIGIKTRKQGFASRFQDIEKSMNGWRSIFSKCYQRNPKTPDIGE
jgi:hypothetical protein